MAYTIMRAQATTGGKVMLVVGDEYGEDSPIVVSPDEAEKFAQEILGAAGAARVLAKPSPTGKPVIDRRKL